MNEWQAVLKPAAFDVNGIIRAGDIEAQCPLPKPIPADQVIVKCMYPPLQQKAEIKVEVKETFIRFYVPIALPFDVQFIALIFLYEAAEVEQLKKYAEEVGSEFIKKQTPTLPSTLICE